MPEHIDPTTTVTPPVVEAPKAAPIGITSEQLSQRLAEERTKGEAALLAKLGFAKSDDAVTALTAAKALQQAQMSEQEKLAARVKELEPLAAQAASAQALAASLVDAQFAALPDTAKAAIDASAKGDPAKRAELMSVMRAAGLLGAPAAPAAPPPLPVPGSTTTPAAPPPPASPSSPNHVAVWESLRTSNPVLAANYYLANAGAINAARRATT